MDFLSLIWFLVVGAIICFTFVKKSNNRKAAESGADKERIRTAAGMMVSENGSNQMIYAHWEEQKSYGRTVKITYYRYVVTFQGQTLCIAPLQVDKKTKQLQVFQPMVFTPENLGKVTVKTKQKNGVVQQIKLWLGDKQGHKIIELTMDAENLRKNNYFPFNLMQQEECTAFERFITSLAQYVDTENPNVDALMKAEQNEGSGLIGVIFSIIGAVFGIFFAPLGIILCLIGLAITIISKKKGAKGNTYLIISIVCTMVTAASCVMFLTSFF